MLSLALLLAASGPVPRTAEEAARARAALRLLWDLRPDDDEGEHYRTLVEHLAEGGLWADTLPKDPWRHIRAAFLLLVGEEPPEDEQALVDALRTRRDGDIACR